MAREYPDEARVAVGVVVIHDGRVLLVERAQPPSEGQWAVPGGMVELGETLKEAAEREVLEETGVLVRAGEHVHTFDSVVRDEEGRVKFHYVVLDLLAEYMSGKPVARDDVRKARWVSPAGLGGLRLSRFTHDLLVRKLGFGATDRPQTRATSSEAEEPKLDK